MTLHAAAGRWESAAGAASAAVLISGGLAGLGGDLMRTAHETVRARADAVCARAECARRIAGLVLLGLDEALPRALDLGLGGRPVGPAGTLDGLAGL